MYDKFHATEQNNIAIVSQILHNPMYFPYGSKQYHTLGSVMYYTKLSQFLMVQALCLFIIIIFM